MAYKNQERSGDAYINDVYRRGTDGITLDVSYFFQGPKHTTCVRHKMNFEFCEMRYMGSEFHKIMAELLTEWKDAKADISGES